MDLALMAGDVEMARECCEGVVGFQEIALAHVPHHPLLALQRFTLADLQVSELGLAARTCLRAGARARVRS